MNESIQSHVIRRIMRVQNQHGRAVTAREVYSTSSRDRDEVIEEIERLIEAGMVGTTRPERQGMGRPTTYIYLVNEWKPSPDARVLDPSPELIDSGEPNPYVKPTHRTPHPKTKLHEELAALTSHDSHEEYFQIMGPHVWVYLKQHPGSTQAEVQTSLVGSKPDREQRVLFFYTWKRLSNRAYDEAYTKWHITESTKSKTKSDLPDKRRTAQRFSVPEQPPVINDSKIDTQAGAQRTEISALRKQFAEEPEKIELAIKNWHFPEPSNDLPDMSRFEATVKMLLG